MNILRKMTSIIISIMMVCTVFLHVDAYATNEGVTSLTSLQDALSVGGVVKLGSDIGSNERLTISENIAIDLNGYKLSVISDYQNGINIEIGKTLTVFDSKYTDKIHGNGKLYVKGHTGIRTTGATLIINSGIIEATATTGAGIGGSGDGDYCDGGTLIINGGVVTAKGDIAGTFGGAGIGGVEKGDGGSITINGGTITAIGGGGAGIGGGGTASYDCGSGGTISINGGKVTAIGGWGSGIGSGNSYGNIGTVSITGGIVKAKAGGKNTYDVGSGKNNDIGGTLNVNGGTLELTTKERGLNVEDSSFSNCVVTGAGSGNFKGVYNTDGNLKKVSITFDSNGGKIVNKAKEIVDNICIRNIKLPKTPVRNGYIFKGWYTKLSGGEKITEGSTVPLVATTYYAQWTKK